MGLEDLTLRDWMVIIGVLLIVAVLVDAYRRVHHERRNRVRLKARPFRDGTEERRDDISMLKELPTGGARVVPRNKRAEYDSPAAEHHAAPHGDEPARTDEPVAAPPEEPAETMEASAPEQFAEASHAAEATRDDLERSNRGRQRHRDEDPVPLVEGMSGRDEEPTNLDWLEDLPLEASRESGREGGGDSPGRLPRDTEPEVFMANVVARDPNGFRGEDILHILLACDLRFGDMNFFHRHEQPSGRGPIQFSVANMVKPGVFDIDNMSSLRTPGLVFFLTLPGPADMMQAYDYMIETARVVARNLGGDVLDETRSALTAQTLDHARQQIRDLERRLLARSGR